MEKFIEDLQLGIYQTFILDNNYQYFLNGIVVTLEVTVFALLIGLLLGVIIAIVRSAHDQQTPGRKNPVLSFFNAICQV